MSTAPKSLTYRAVWLGYFASSSRFLTTGGALAKQVTLAGQELS